MNNNNYNSSGCNIHLKSELTRGIAVAFKSTGSAIFMLCLVSFLTVSKETAADTYVVRTPIDAGTVQGRVFAGSATPLIKRISIFKDQEICGIGHRDVSLVQVNGDRLLNTVVYLEDISFGKPFRAAAKKITINQLGCRFIPYLSVMANGGEMEVINSDTILHNIHTYEIDGPLNYSQFSVSQPHRGNILIKQIELERNVGLKVTCDAHDFMRSYVFVARNPYYGVVDGSGNFLIDNVPPGTYTIKTWHGTLGPQEAIIEVQANNVAYIDFSY